MEASFASLRVEVSGPSRRLGEAAHLFQQRSGSVCHSFRGWRDSESQREMHELGADSARFRDEKSRKHHQYVLTCAENAKSSVPNARLHSLEAPFVVSRNFRDRAGRCDGRRHIRPICSCFSPSSRHIASKTASSAIQSRTQICVGSGSRAPKLRRAELGTCVNTFDQLHPTKIDQQTTAERPQIPTIRLRCRKVEVPSPAELGNEQSGDDAEGMAPPCGGGRTQLGRLVFLRALRKTPTERLGPSVGACSWVDRRARRGPPRS